MAMLTCADGSVLAVLPEPVLDRDGVAYEVTLRLVRDGRPFGQVGERCGYFLAATAARLRAARAAGKEYPASSVEAGVEAWAADTGHERAWPELQRYLPRDRELFCFRSRDPDDLRAAGELRVTFELERRWAAGWQVRCLAVVQAWGSGDTGVRAVLDSDQLLVFLEELVEDFAAVGARYAAEEDGSALRRPVG